MEDILVNEYRAEILECTHRGHIAVVDEHGRVIFSAGDPQFVAFTRSSAKPFQAIPGVREGIKDRYQLNEKEIALMTASHTAEQFHIKTLDEMREKIGLHDSQLTCGASYPLNVHSKEQILRDHKGRRQLYHNCSGKHLGVLAYCKAMGFPLAGYIDPDHPAQQEIRRTFAYMCELSPDQLKTGIDGCGFPVFALPLSKLALGYLKLANPEMIEDEATRKAVETITHAMNKHPEYVGGTGRVDSILLKDKNIVSKGGFKGVYAFALRKERIGVAFKILDGSEEEWAIIIESILKQIGYENQSLFEELKYHFPNQLYNDSAHQVGYTEAAFKLKHFA